MISTVASEPSIRKWEWNIIRREITKKIMKQETYPRKPDAPEGWHWAISSRGRGFYTHWLYSNAVLYRDGEFGWEAEVYHDEGQKHTVNFYQYTKWDPDGDNSVDYPSHSKQFDSEEEALEYAVEKAEELR